MKQQYYKWIAVVLVGLGTIGLSGRGMLGLHAKETYSPNEASAAVRREGERLIVPEKSPLRKSLVVAAMSEQTVTVPFSLPSVVEADPSKLVKMLSPLAGRIVKLNKQLGDEVKAGDVLFMIDSADLAQALSDASKAQSSMTLAKRNLERQRDLDKADIAAKRDLEQAQNDYEQAASEFARANGRLAQLGAKRSAAASHSLEGHTLTVRSPISGRVVDLNAATGGYWNDTNAALMTVADLSTVFVTASAQEKDLGQLYVGQSVDVIMDAYGEPQRTKVRYISEMLDPDTRTVKVRMMFDNRDGRLKPGMFAQATFLGRPHQGLMAPMTAVVQSGFYNRAFVEVAPWQFEARAVKLGAQIGDNVEVVAGVKAGERVVVREGVLLND